MSAPVVTGLTGEVYGSLPEVYRTADAAQPGGANNYPLLRFLACLGDVAQAMDDLYFRLAYTAPTDGGPATGPGSTSDLVDPATADPSWLPWLAQLVGVRLDQSLPVETQRASVRAASTGRLAGTHDAIAAAAQSALTGTRAVQVLNHTTVTTTSMQVGTMWDLTVVTRADETPSIQAVLAAIVAAGAKPAGTVLHHFVYTASWARQTSTFPSWAALRAAGSWAAIENATPVTTGTPGDGGTGSPAGTVTATVGATV